MQKLARATGGRGRSTDQSRADGARKVASTGDALAQALAHHHAGRFAEAERLYRAILRAQPRHPDANHNMGALALQACRPKEAAPYFEAALKASPDQGRFWTSYMDALLRDARPDAALRVLEQGRRNGLAGAAIDRLSGWAALAAQGGPAMAEAVAHHLAGRFTEAVASYRRTLAVRPDHAAGHRSLGLALVKAGRLEEAATSYRAAIALAPGDAGAHSDLGSILRDLGRFDDAVASCRRAVELRPTLVEAHYNGALALQGLGRLAEAAAGYRSALDLDPALAPAHNNLGNVLRDLGRLEDAAASYRRTVELKADAHGAHGNLARTLRDLGRLADAEASCRTALAVKPDYAEGHNILGIILHDLGRVDEAEASYRRALWLKADFPDAHANLGVVLFALGRLDEALRSGMAALRHGGTASAKTLFVDCIMRMRLTTCGDEVRAALTTALLEPWGRPSHLVPAAAMLVKRHPDIAPAIAAAAGAWPHRPPGAQLFTPAVRAALSADGLLRALLISAPVGDLDLERFLTAARHALLTAAVGGRKEWDADLLGFHCALARQCFVNEYLFDLTQAEAAEATALREQVAAALDGGEPVPEPWLIAVACYFPLHSLPACERLLDGDWPEAIAAVLTQQVREPHEESRLRGDIARITTVDDEVSRLVQRQYEENPYPRWIKAAPVAQPLAFDTALRRALPLAAFEPLGKAAGLDVLIAGCGTGQQAVDAARIYQGAQILAVDLSLPSLSYASRKASELGVDAVTFGQADIMALGALDRRFDVIEASGVLHHLADPMAGWRVLLGLLRPGGFMRIGLYSELARREVVRGRAFIAERTYGATNEDIRRCRQDMLAEGFASMLGWADFFSTSACRDLLFHVQEHRLTLDAIDGFLADAGLRFLGFETDKPVVDAYRRRFPDDATATNLGNWSAFEADNPDTFRNMYQFWVQRPR